MLLGDGRAVRISSIRSLQNAVILGCSSTGTLPGVLCDAIFSYNTAPSTVQAMGCDTGTMMRVCKLGSSLDCSSGIWVLRGYCVKSVFPQDVVCAWAAVHLELLHFFVDFGQVRLAKLKIFCVQGHDRCVLSRDMDGVPQILHESI